MAIGLYDEALVDKLSKWTRNIKDLKILKPEESTRFFEMTLDQIKDRKVTLPLISISRDKNIELLNTQKQSKTFDGYRFLTNEKRLLSINVIPIQLKYQIDIYTRYMQEADEYLRNFIFNFINYPKLEIVLPYNDFQFKHESNIQLESSVSDNSDIKEHLFADQFVRFTLNITVDDAYLFSIPYREPVIISEISLSSTDNIDKEIVHKDST